MDAQPSQTITAEELDVRLRFMMDDEFAMLDRAATRGSVTGPFVVRASRVLLRMWDAVGGKPVNNKQHIKQIKIGTPKTELTKTGQTAFALHKPVPCNQSRYWIALLSNSVFKPTNNCSLR